MEPLLYTLSRQWHALLFLSCGLLCACALPGCQRSDAVTAGLQQQARVELRDIVETCAEDGFLEPAKVSAIPVDFDARVLEVCIREGDSVKAGDVLVRLNPAELDARLRATEAEERALCVRRESFRFKREDLERLEADQQRARAELEFAELERAARLQEELFAAGIASERERDAARLRLESAKAGLELAGMRLDEVKSGLAASPEVAELDARIERMSLELKQLRKRVETCAVTAPFDGVVIFMDRSLKRLHIPEGGARFQPEQGGVMAIVADIDSMSVAAEFFERDVARLKPGLPVLVTARHAPGRTFKGVISSIGRQGKRHGQTAVVPVEVSVPNPDHALTAGLTAEIRVVTGERRSVPALPVAFVGRDSDGRFAWRVGRDARLERVALETGLSDGHYIEVVSGLREGDIVAMESP